MSKLEGVREPPQKKLFWENLQETYIRLLAELHTIKGLIFIFSHTSLRIKVQYRTWSVPTFFYKEAEATRQDSTNTRKPNLQIPVQPAHAVQSQGTAVYGNITYVGTGYPENARWRAGHTSKLISGHLTGTGRGTELRLGVAAHFSNTVHLHKGSRC